MRSTAIEYSDGNIIVIESDSDETAKTISSGVIGEQTKVFYSKDIDHSTVDDSMNVIGKFLKSQRKKRKLTQLQLAELSGVSINTLRNIEQNAYNPSLKSVLKLITTLNIDLEDLEILVSYI